MDVFGSKQTPEKPYKSFLLFFPSSFFLLVYLFVCFDFKDMPSHTMYVIFLYFVILYSILSTALNIILLFDMNETDRDRNQSYIKSTANRKLRYQNVNKLEFDLCVCEAKQVNSGGKISRKTNRRKRRMKNRKNNTCEPDMIAPSM